MANDFLDSLPDETAEVVGVKDDFLSSIPDEKPRDIGLRSSHEIKPLVPSHATEKDQFRVAKALTDSIYFRQVMGVPIKQETALQYPLDDSHPEAKNLQSFSGMVVNHWDSTQRAIERADLFSQRNTRLMLGQDTGDIDERLSSAGKVEKFRKPANPIEKAIVYTAEQVPYFVDTIKEGSRMGMAAALVGTAGYLAGTGGAGLPAAPMMFSSLYGAGAMVGSSKRLWEVAEGMSFEEMTERGVNEQDAMLASRFIVGPLSATLNTIGLRQVSKVIPGMDKIIGAATQKASTKIARTIPQIIGKQAAEVGKTVGVEAFTENLDELAQAAGTQIGIELTNAFDNKGLSSVTIDEIKERMLAVTEATIYATATMGGVGGAIGTALDVRSIKEESKQREKIVDVIETAIEKTEPIVREKARASGAVIVGVNEDADGNVTGLLMADRKTGNFFETGPNPTPSEIAEFTGAEVGIDETVDRIISAEDLDAEISKLFPDETDMVTVAEEDSVPKRKITEILKDINTAIGDVGAIGAGFDPTSVSPLINELGQSVWDSGARTFDQFADVVKKQAGQAWEAIKEIAVQAWEAVKRFNEGLGEVGAIGRDVGVKKRVREITGQADTTAKVTERTALKASFTKAAQAARFAFREGKKEALSSAKVELANIVAKMKTRQAEAVGKIMTEKEKVQRRKTSIRDIRDYFGLTDNDLKKISKKDPRLMSDYEFKKFKDAMQLRAVEVAETRQAKLELLSTIDALRLEKVDNYRQALALPPISEMTAEELRKFDQLLSQQQEGDSFLNRRQLETVDRTFLSGIKTWREARAKLAEEAGVSIGDLEKIKVSGWDNFRWDTLLYEANPFYRVLVTRVNSALLDGQLKAHEIESKTYALAKKAQDSVSRGVLERVVPTDETIFNYLEANSEGKKAIAGHMTKEQIDLAHYMQEYFSQALMYLMETKSLEKGRENYFVHMRRSFLETIKDDGLTSAVKQMFQNYEQDEMAFGILNDATGQILPLEKFFQFSLRRTGELTPTKNIVKAFLTYVNTFEKKVALDGIIPAMDIYAQSLTPTKYTPRGLEIDRSIKEFAYKYINNKKGRKISFDSVLKQGGRLDLAINGIRTLTTMLDLGFNVISQIASPIGEQAANMLQMGITNQAKGTARWQTAQGKKIVKKYEAFVGRTFWEQFTAPGLEATERMSSALFAGFHVGSRIANAQFLLGMMTDEEYRAGEISADRLAELKIDMGRFRVVGGDSSLVGSTSVGKAGIQYKSWAIPVLHRTVKDISVLLKDLWNKPVGEALTTRESIEFARIVGVAATITSASAAFSSDEEDDSFVGKLLARAYQEANVLYSAFDTKMMVGVPRTFTYLQQLAINIASTVKLEEYKTKEGLKGPDKLIRQHTPRLIKQFQPEDEKKKKF